jgi:hypothetical protein
MLCHDLAASRCHCFEISGDPASGRQGPGRQPGRLAKAAHVAMPLSQATRIASSQRCLFLACVMGEGCLSALPRPAQTAHPHIDVHPNVEAEPLAPSFELQPRQLCCDWSSVRINQAKCWNGRHYVGTAGYAPPDQDIPARRIYSAWRPTYTLSYMLWYLYTDIQQAPPPSPKSSRVSIY